MKVVLFCGGLGTRLREHSDTIPKPLVSIGSRPIIWHLMRYYAHYGHNDFILALGYRGEMIREYFLNYDECMSNDFVLYGDSRKTELLSSDVHNWRITFTDTGVHSNLGERLMRVRKYLDGESMFLANYSDGLSDLPLDSYLDDFVAQNLTASFVSVRPSQSFHLVETAADNRVAELRPMTGSDVWVNGGFFCFRSEIFDYMREGEELVEEPFSRLIEKRQLWSPRYTGFWAAMDTFKDKIRFDRMEARDQCPWKVWLDDAG